MPSPRNEYSRVLDLKIVRDGLVPRNPSGYSGGLSFSNEPEKYERSFSPTDGRPRRGVRRVRFSSRNGSSESFVSADGRRALYSALERAVRTDVYPTPVVVFNVRFRRGRRAQKKKKRGRDTTETTIMMSAFRRLRANDSRGVCVNNTRTTTAAAHRSERF